VAAADKKPQRQLRSRPRLQEGGSSSEASAPAGASEAEPLLPTYGSIQGDFAKANGLGAPPLLGYEDEETGLDR
jgi:hypothetical protein